MQLAGEGEVAIDQPVVVKENETVCLSRIQAQWHEIPTAILYETVGGFELENTLSTTTDIAQLIPTSNLVPIWYLARLLPLHLMNARLWRNVTTLLLDKWFLRYQHTACRVIDGAKLYIQESLVFSNIIGQGESCRSSEPNGVRA